MAKKLPDKASSVLAESTPFHDLLKVSNRDAISILFKEKKERIVKYCNF